MKGTTAIASILRAEGVDFVGCIPSHPLLDALALEDIRLIIPRQERVGINMVDGFSRVTNGRRTGVFLMQAQAGAENGFPGVAQAYDDSTPILLLPAGAPRDRAGVHPTFSPPRSYADVTKWADQVNLVQRIPEMFRRAFTSLRTGRPGPVLLELPTDVTSEDLDEAIFSYRPVPARRSAGDPRDVEEAATALLKARRPVLHAGQGVLYAEAWDELRELAELLQAPVMTTLGAKGVFPEDHPLSLGAGGATTTAPVVHFLQGADLVAGIGCSFSLTGFGVTIPPGKVMVQVTNDEIDINKDYAIDHAVIGDAKLVLQQLLEEVRARTKGSSREVDGVASEVAAVKEQWLASWMPRFTSNEVPINPFRVVWDLMQTVDRRRTIVTPDSGSPRDQMSPFYEALFPRGFIGWGKSTQLGSSLGFAMGAKLAAPDKLAVNVLGDTAFGMVGLDFETAVRERIPILTVLLNNSGMGIYGPDQFPAAQERYRIKDLGGKYAEVAAAMGGYSRRVDRPEEVVPALQEAIRVVEDGTPALLEFVTSREHASSVRLR